MANPNSRNGGADIKENEMSAQEMHPGVIAHKMGPAVEIMRSALIQGQFKDLEAWLAESTEDSNPPAISTPQQPADQDGSTP
jgi:hypothetical protein